MPAANNPLTPDPETTIDSPPPPDPPPQEDLSQPVPVGEPPDDGGYVIEEEDPEYGPPVDPGRRKRQPRPPHLS